MDQFRARLTVEPDGTLCVETAPFNRAFVDGIKQVIDFRARSWAPERKRWLVSALYTTELLDLLQQLGAQVTDDRPPPPVTPSPALGQAMPDDLRQAYDVLFLAYHAPLPVVEAVYRHLAKLLHPDHGGDTEAFHRINDAITTIRRYAAGPDDQHDDAIPF